MHFNPDSLTFVSLFYKFLAYIENNLTIGVMKSGLRY